MANFADDSKGAAGLVFPDGADNDTPQANWSRNAPLITPPEVINKHLFGIPLVSGTKDPVTKKAARYTTEMIRDKIDDVVAQVEIETGISIFPVQKTRKMAFDLNEYRSFGYFRLPDRPVMSIETLRVTPSNDIDVYDVPLDWIDTANMHTGQINIIPLTIALTKQGTIVPTSTAGGALMLAILGHSSWVPAFWKIEYTVGFPSGSIPKVVNDLIGTVTGIEVLSQLAATYARNSSGSLGIDGLSQSVSTPGPEIFSRRITDLEKKRAMLTKKIKVLYGTTLFSSNV